MHGPLRLLADDLTGALDSAAAAAPAFGPVSVTWAGSAQPQAAASLAVSTESRDAPRSDAAARAGRAAERLFGEGVAFKKIDSLLRGHPAEEIAACMACGSFDNAVIAPAFPAQGRRMVAGVQRWTLPDGSEGGTDRPLADRLRAAGLAATPVRAGAALPAGVSVCDAESDAELDSILARGLRLPGRTLWCGTGGLAAAFGRRSSAAGREALRPARPLLGVVGTNHPVTAGQVEALRRSGAAAVLPFTGGNVASADDHLGRGCGVLLTAALPEGTPGATSMIAGALRAILGGLPRPGAIFVAGGETCRAMCDALGCSRLDVEGLWRPGIPVSRMHDGRWAGTGIFSKSGAFGGPDTLIHLFGAAEEAAP